MKNSIFWAIQLAFVDKGEIQFSIMYFPKLDELYYAIKGKGVFLNYKKINLRKDVPLNESIIEFCGSMHKMYDEKKKLFDKIIKNNVRPANYMHVNCCAFAFANLLAERTNTLVVSTNKPWDVLPGIFMIEEAGVSTYNYDGVNVYTVTKDMDKVLK